MFEFQTAMSELTGLPVSNAGLFEGPSSVASAGYLAMNATKRAKFVVSRGVHPHSRETLATYSVGYGAEVVEVGLEGGVTYPAALAAAVDGDTAAVILQSPNFLGAVEDIEALGAAAKTTGRHCRPRSRSSSMRTRRRTRHSARPTWHSRASRCTPMTEQSVLSVRSPDLGRDDHFRTFVRSN